MEYCDGGSLATLAKGSVLTEPEIAFIIRQVISLFLFFSFFLSFSRSRSNVTHECWVDCRGSRFFT
jgi:serine/threonine protein kinase